MLGKHATTELHPSPKTPYICVYVYVCVCVCVCVYTHIYIYVYMSIMGFELKASCLLGRHFTTRNTLLALFVLG
jgi:hypothetical protein